MPPVRIYTDSPINAAKASGQTPETKAGEASSQAAATTTSQVTQGYAAAQPGAVPSIPAPTGSVQTHQYAPLQPTPTRNLADQGPPPPQPGAVPLPPAGRTAVPPPPRAGEAYHAPEVTQAAHLPPMPYPPQMSMPSPAAPYSQRGTATAMGPSRSSPGQLLGPYGSAEPLAHPPGYQQNVNASELSGHQRAEQTAFLASHHGNTSADGAEDGVWNSAMKWAQVAGEKISAAENEVWRRISKE
ncbi:hypothetical protein QBC46DRAFT_374029 [Diplogelasinospora grovesii]|uniref:Uncharacterized protein n=1 Tax=Diplogelasinospora grovesii TaxID=303347 RepID=A0AAN6NGF6_9PEZI|nr:hypothetical protein QBC46DRAFT_374029 [Diplogelasinospora grovesii]